MLVMEQQWLTRRLSMEKVNVRRGGLQENDTKFRSSIFMIEASIFLSPAIAAITAKFPNIPTTVRIMNSDPKKNAHRTKTNLIAAEMFTSCIISTKSLSFIPLNTRTTKFLRLDRQSSVSACWFLRLNSLANRSIQCHADIFGTKRDVAMIKARDYVKTSTCKNI